MENFLDKTRKMLDDNQSKIKDQVELIDKLKITKELNDTLEKDNFLLKKRNESLENIIANLVDDISNNICSANQIHEEKLNKLRDACKSYEDLIKMKDKNLMEITQQLELQTEDKNKFYSESLDLKHKVESYNDTITNLQEKEKLNNVLIPLLQKELFDRNENLSKTYQKLRDSITYLSIEKKEKNEWENQSKEYLKEIQKLTANCMKYKSKAKQFYAYIRRLRCQGSQSEQKKTPQVPRIIDTIDLISDDEGNNIAVDDVSTVELSDWDVSNTGVSIQSTSSKINQNYSNYKRNFSPLPFVSNSSIKKRKTLDDAAALQENVSYSQNAKIFQNKSNLVLNCPKKKFNGNNKVNNQVDLNAISNLDDKKTFKIPAEMSWGFFSSRLHDKFKSVFRKKQKPTNVQRNIQTKPKSLK